MIPLPPRSTPFPYTTLFRSLALFGAIFSGNQSDLNVLIPGIAGMSIMATTFSSLVMNLTFLREQGVLKRMRGRSEEHTSELQSYVNLVCRLLLEKINHPRRQ